MFVERAARLEFEGIAGEDEAYTAWCRLDLRIERRECGKRIRCVGNRTIGRNRRCLRHAQCLPGSAALEQARQQQDRKQPQTAHDRDMARWTSRSADFFFKSSRLS